MYDSRPEAHADRIAVARLDGTAQRHVPRWWADPSPEQIAAAVAELRSITTRPGLLAEAAGTMIGFSESDIDARYKRIAGMYCVLAGGGTDEQLLLSWIAAGRERRERARGSVPWQDWSPRGT